MSYLFHLPTVKPCIIVKPALLVASGYSDMKNKKDTTKQGDRKDKKKKNSERTQKELKGNGKNKTLIYRQK